MQQHQPSHLEEKRHVLPVQAAGEGGCYAQIYGTTFNRSMIHQGRVVSPHKRRELFFVKAS